MVKTMIAVTEYCAACDLEFDKEAFYEDHIESEKHLLKLKENTFLSDRFYRILSSFRQQLLTIDSPPCCAASKKEHNFIAQAICPSSSHVDKLSPNATLISSNYELHAHNSVCSNYQDSETNIYFANPLKRKILIESEQSEHQKEGNNVNNSIDSDQENKDVKSRLEIDCSRAMRDDDAFLEGQCHEKRILVDKIQSPDKCITQIRDNLGTVCKTATAFNQPFKGTREIFASTNMSSVEKHCNFFIYQCLACKALINNERNFVEHFESSEHKQNCYSEKQENSGIMSIACLLCDNRLLSGDDLINKHRSSEKHRKELRKMAFSMSGNFESLCEELLNLRGENSNLQPTLQSIVQFSCTLTKKIEFISVLARLIVMASRDLSSNFDLCIFNKRLSPELQKIWDQGCLYLLPQSLRKFRGMFLCTICSAASSDLFNFVQHAVLDLEHLRQSSFKPPMTCCFSCDELHHFQNFEGLFSISKSKHHKSKNQFDCIRTEESKLRKETKLQKLLYKNGTLKLNSFLCCLVCLSCPSLSKLHNLFEVYQHLTSSNHLGSTYSICVECHDCKCSFYSFSAAVGHVMTDCKKSVKN
ncbi:uncharacterized protein LOC142345907 [Convolutriloba macropyga]|uniref:uncharacterized protein LOC142345907 n=1 Tax=Convolutriloba macropyga TaxID=536237 RepID=UPI003F51D06F